MKTFKGALLFLCAMIVIGCNDKKKSVPVIEILTDSTVVDTTVYGRCGDGTAMHTLEDVDYTVKAFKAVAEKLARGEYSKDIVVDANAR